jgi:hypothetical protein
MTIIGVALWMEVPSFDVWARARSVMKMTA